jgi:hypothetical protein
MKNPFLGSLNCWDWEAFDEAVDAYYAACETADKPAVFQTFEKEKVVADSEGEQRRMVPIIVPTSDPKQPCGTLMDYGEIVRCILHRFTEDYKLGPVGLEQVQRGFWRAAAQHCNAYTQTTPPSSSCTGAEVGGHVQHEAIGKAQAAGSSASHG